jgi:predicted  nucleic acid-binding Zn-ribbon protein
VVNEQLRLLVELQKLDSSIISFDKTIKAIPAKISTMQEPLTKAQAALDRQKKTIEDAEKKKRDKDSALEEIQDKIEKMKDRTGDIKDNKAYQAHLKEIEKAEKGRYEIEDEILALMEAVDEESKKLKEADSVLQEENRKVDDMKKQLEAEVKEAEEELQALKDKRKTFTDAIEKENYETYMTLLTSRDGFAVSRAANEICTGCNMNIMPQLFVEIKKNDRIIQCPQCGRILYFKPE